MVESFGFRVLGFGAGEGAQHKTGSTLGPKPHLWKLAAPEPYTCPINSIKAEKTVSTPCSQVDTTFRA